MPDVEGSQDSINATTEGLIAVHELFVGMLAAGFTEWQACRVLGVFLAEQGRQQ